MQQPPQSSQQQAVSVPFSHHHTFLSPYGSIEDAPFITHMITKPLKTLTPSPRCPAEFVQMVRLAPQSNLIIAITSVFNRNTLQVYLHDARTDRLTIYKDYLNQEGPITALCEDPLNPNLFLMTTENGLLAEFDLFAPQLVPKAMGKKTKGWTAVDTNGQVVVAASGSRLIFLNRISGQQVSIDNSMHQSDITTVLFHPQHKNFLFTADDVGMINAFDMSLAGSAARFNLDELYIGTVQLPGAVDIMKFFGPNAQNYTYFAAIAQTTASFSLVSFDCLDETSVFEVIQCDMRKLLNESIVAQTGYSPELFYSEFTDEDAENNITAGFTIEDNVMGGDGAVVVDYFHHEEMQIEHDNMSDSMSMSSHNNNQMGGGNDGDGDDDDDEIINTTNQFQTTQQIPQQQQPAQSAATLFSSMFTTANQNSLNVGTITTTAPIMQDDDINHPRNWRITSILNCFYLPDFSNPSQQSNNNELFIMAGTSAGGIVIATVTTVVDPQTRKGNVVITKLIPSVAPNTAHDISPFTATLILGSITTPVIITGGRDGRLALFDTNAQHEAIKQQFPSIFAELALDISRVEDGPRKKKGQRRNNSGKKTQSGASTAGLGDSESTSKPIGKPTGASGKKNRK